MVFCHCLQWSWDDRVGVSPGERPERGKPARNVMTPWPCRWALGRWAFWAEGEGVDGTLKTKEDVDENREKHHEFLQQQLNRDVAKFFFLKEIEEKWVLY